MVNIMVMLLDAALIVFLLLLIAAFAVPFFVPLINNFIAENTILLVLMGAFLVFIVITVINGLIADFSK